MHDKMDFKIPVPPPYMREVQKCTYRKNASTESIQLSLSSIDWDFLFRGNLSAKRLT